MRSATVWLPALHARGLETWGQEAHLCAFPLITGSAWRLPLHNGFASASRLPPPGLAVFPGGVPPGNRDREDEQPFVTMPSPTPASTPALSTNHPHAAPTPWGPSPLNWPFTNVLIGGVRALVWGLCMILCLYYADFNTIPTPFGFHWLVLLKLCNLLLKRMGKKVDKKEIRNYQSRSL